METYAKSTDENEIAQEEFLEIITKRFEKSLPLESMNVVLLLDQMQ